MWEHWTPSLCAAVSLASSFFLRVFLPPDFARRRRGRPRPTQPTQAGSSDPVSAAVSLISRLHSLCIFCPTHQTGPLPNRAGESIGGKLICSPFPWDLWKMIHFASERKISASWFHQRSCFLPTLVLGKMPSAMPGKPSKCSKCMASLQNLGLKIILLFILGSTEGSKTVLLNQNRICFCNFKVLETKSLQPIVVVVTWFGWAAESKAVAAKMLFASDVTNLPTPSWLAGNKGRSPKWVQILVEMFKIPSGGHYHADGRGGEYFTSGESRQSSAPAQPWGKNLFQAFTQIPEKFQEESPIPVFLFT